MGRNLRPHKGGLTPIQAVGPILVLILPARVARSALAADDTVHVYNYINAPGSTIGDQPVEDDKRICTPSRAGRIRDRVKVVPRRL
jgi:hypothetical protein